MLLIRCIGIYEFYELLKGNNIQGRYNIGNEVQSTGVGNNKVCAFVDEVYWLDKKHKMVAILNIPEDRLSFGTGDYWAAKSFAKTHVWSGRKGSVQYFIREAYFDSYNITDVVSLSLPFHTDRYMTMYREVLNKYNIKEFDIRTIL